jgi:hypothetical protein
MDPQERLVGFSVLLSPSDYALDNFNISTLNKNNYAFLHAFNTIYNPLMEWKKIGSREPVVTHQRC